MLLGLFLHFYIIFGTNLLTGGPTQIVVFLPILGFRWKGRSNGVQMETLQKNTLLWRAIYHHGSGHFRNDNFGNVMEHFYDSTGMTILILS